LIDAGFNTGFNLKIKWRWSSASF